MERLNNGDEVFVCVKWRRGDPDSWRDCRVVNSSQKYFKVSRLQAERFRQKDRQTPDKVLVAFIPTAKERKLWAETMKRSELISEIVRQDWSALSFGTLEKIVNTLKEKADDFTNHK